MNHATETAADAVFCEAAEIRRMVDELCRDIDARKEPDGPYPRAYREDRGRRMTLKRSRGRLHHIQARLRTFVERLPNTDSAT